VESLLKSHQQTGNFVDEPAYEFAAEILVRERELKPGQSIAHCKVISVLGEGGMGKVYLAQDTKLDRKVALKILSAALASNADHMHRFTHEAKTAAALHHPNIAQIFEVGEDDHIRYIAMEYVPGETLRQLISRRRLNIKRSIDYAAQAASALAAAHKQGIIHRDIKPENLIVTTDGLIKVLDFGLAKLIEKERIVSGVSELTTIQVPSNRNETQPGVIMGTVSYMSPEQARAEKLDNRTDIFSLAVVLYEMVTGDRPFKGKSVIDTLHAIINQEPPPLVELNSQLPPELADILGKALTKEPAERYQHAGDFELDLRRLKKAIESNTLISTQSRALNTKAEKRRWLGPWSLIVGVSFVAIIAIVVWILGHSTASTEVALASLTTTTLTPLTADPGYEGEPTFSPDGQTIAYVSDRSGNFEIFLKQISGGPDINLTKSGADDVQPAFSPDGKQIAFVSTRSSSSNLLYPGVDYSLLGGDIWVMPALVESLNLATSRHGRRMDQ
jgi:eukaryotic-like serine/threonine-protein kinase